MDLKLKRTPINRGANVHPGYQKLSGKNKFLRYHFINSAEVFLSCRNEGFLEGRGVKEKLCSNSHFCPAIFPTVNVCLQNYESSESSLVFINELYTCRCLQPNQRQVCSPSTNKRPVWTVCFGLPNNGGVSHLTFPPILDGSFMRFQDNRCH